MEFDTVIHSGTIATADGTAKGDIGIRDGLAVMKTDLGDGVQRNLVRGLAVVVAAVAYYFAVASKVSIVALLLGAYGGVAQIFPLVFAAFYWPRATAAGALSGLAAGIAVSTFFFLVPEARPVPLHEGIFGLAANLLCLVAVSLVTRPSDPEAVRAFQET